MTSTAKGWTPRERALLMLCVASLGISIAGYLDLGGSAGGAPRGSDGVGSSVTSGEIRDGTIRGRDIGPTITSADIRDGSIRASDLDIYYNRAFAQELISTSIGGTRAVTAACDPGDRVISGGFGNTNPESVGLFGFNFGGALDRWTVTALKFGQNNSFVTAWATCLNNN